MRQIGTITQNVTFIPVKGSDFYDDFFDEKGKVEVESVIESVYCNSMLKSTSGKLDLNLREKRLNFSEYKNVNVILKETVLLINIK